MDKIAESGTGKRLLNTLFNPFTTDTLTPSQSSPTKRSLTHAAGLFAGYGGLAYLLRELIKADRRKIDETELEALRASAAEREEEAELDKLEKKAFVDFNLEELVRKYEAGQLDTKHLALALSAAVAGGYAGYRVADRVQDVNRKQQLSKEISEKREDIDEALAEEFQATRGLGEHNLLKSAQEDTMLGRTGSTIGTAATNPLSTLAVIGLPIYWMWVAAALALSYKASKDYFDETDPARARMGRLKEVARQRERVTSPPKFNVSESLAELEAGGGATKDVPKERDLTSVPLPEAETSAPTEVDKRDPYASVLKV